MRGLLAFGPRKWFWSRDHKAERSNFRTPWGLTRVSAMGLPMAVGGGVGGGGFGSEVDAGAWRDVVGWEGLKAAGGCGLAAGA